MAHFIGYLKGNRGEASRLGSSQSGIRASAQGWQSGAKIQGQLLDSQGYDLFTVCATSGSNGGESNEWIGSVCRPNGKLILKVNPDGEKHLEEKKWNELVSTLAGIVRNSSYDNERNLIEQILQYLNYKKF